MRRYLSLSLVLVCLGLGCVAALLAPNPPPGWRVGMWCALTGLTACVLFEFFRGNPPLPPPR